jgi:DNA invertase Pin-like site-specific DNA recombinase/predicted DNA-binding transcriptional regulator AlpA
LAERAVELGWRRDQVIVIDEDLGRTGSGAVERPGFDRMASDVALGRVGIILGLDASRLARNGSDWYRLIDLAGMTDTLIADTDGVYHPGLFNDRLLLGLKGTMSEAELHIIRARLTGGIQNKAARGELRCHIPVGYVWHDDEMKVHPNEAIVSAIRNAFARFSELGSARQVWLWFRNQRLPFPNQRKNGEITWEQAKYGQIKEVLRNPVYAGAYTFGKTRKERRIDSTGRIRYRVRDLPREEWQVFIRDHHEGFIDWQTYESNQAQLRNNSPVSSPEVGGALREGAALLQGLATCGRCARRFHVKYNGRNSSPGYYCPGTIFVDGKATSCLIVGARQIDAAVVKVFLETMNTAGIEASLIAEASLETDNDVAIEQWHLEVERVRYEAEKAERRYRAVEPENRLVARGLEAEWEKCLRKLSAAEETLREREKSRPRKLTESERERLGALATDIGLVWSAPTTTDRDRKELLRTVLEEVNIKLEPKASRAHLALYWRGGAITEITVELAPRKIPSFRTDEDTIELLRRLAQFHPDQVIANVLNRQGRRTARGERFSAHGVSRLRKSWKVPKFEPQQEMENGEVVTIDKAAEILGIGSSTLHRYIADGFVAGEQLTPGAPWRIRITDELLSRFTEQNPDGYVPMKTAIALLGVSRQTIMQRIKRGELQAICTRHGRRKELRVKLPKRADSDSTGQLTLF